jgi:hypothetical protein
MTALRSIVSCECSISDTIEEGTDPMIPLGVAKIGFVAGVLALAVQNTLAYADGPSIMDSHIPTPVALTSMGVVIAATWAVGKWSSRFITKNDLRESEKRLLSEMDKRIRSALHEQRGRE